MKDIVLSQLYWNGKQDVKKETPIYWNNYEKGINVASLITTENFSIKLVHIASNTSYVSMSKGMSIVSLLSGELSSPLFGDRPMTEKESGVYDSTPIISVKESLLCIVDVNPQYNTGKTSVQEKLITPKMDWVKFNERVCRSNPKIEISGNNIAFRLNLWYGIPNCDMGIHNHAPNPEDYHNDEPNFKEWHILLRGNGYMTKYKKQDATTEYERYEMQFGQTHPLFCKRRGNRDSYPWHAWKTGSKGSMFIALEDIGK